MAEIMPLKIPTYDEAHVRVVEGEATPLDRFVIDNEPMGEPAESDFRSGLSALIEHVRKQPITYVGRVPGQTS